MALVPTLETRVDWRTAVRPFRPPLSAVIPGVDAVALGVVALAGRFEALGVLYLAVAIAVLAASGSHRVRINPRLGDDVAPLLGRLAVPVLVVAPFASTVELGRFVKLVPIAVALVLVGRGLSYAVVRSTRARAFIQEPTLIVGAGSLGVKLAQTLEEHPEFGLVPVGFVDSFEETDLPLPVLGDIDRLEVVVGQFGVRRVVVAFGATRDPEMVQVIRACDRLPVEVHVMPRFFELGTKEGRFADDIWGIPLVRLRRSALRTAAWRTKRAFDFALAGIALLLASPVFLGIALAVRLSSPGPVFFRQERIGQRGQVFECLKFRSMRVNDDSSTTWSVGDDDRRTSIGSLLRKTGLDELPQLINVLRGEMSLVGPRPERPHFVDQFRVAVPGYDDRHRVPVGITGWAQVHGLRGDTSIEARAVFDNNYVENWSLWTDVVILGRTVLAVVRGEGA